MTIHGSSEADQRGWTPRLVVSTAAMILVLEIVALSYTMVSTALPQIVTHFRTDQGGWLLTAFILAGAVVSPVFGKLADLYGKRRMLLAALAIAGLGAGLSALAPTYPVMIAGRALQGTVIASMFLTYSLMRDTYPPRILPFAVSVSTTGMGVFSLVTPLLIGWLLDTFGFRGMFAFDVAWIVVLGAVIAASTRESPLRSRARVDVAGAVLLGGGLAAVLVAISMGGSWGWLSPLTLLTGLASVVLLGAFTAVSRRVPEPIMDLRLMVQRPILLAATTAAIAYGATTLSSSMLPLLSMTSREVGGTYGLGLSAFGYSWIASPLALAMVLGGVLVGLAVRRTGARWTMVAGLLMLAAGALLLAFANDTYAEVLTSALFIGLGTGFAYGSVPNLVISGTPPGDQGSVAGTVQVCQSTFASIVPVVLFAVLATQVTAGSGGGAGSVGVVYAEAGFRSGLFLMAGLTLTGALLAVTVLRPPRRQAVAAGSPAAERAARAGSPAETG